MFHLPISQTADKNNLKNTFELSISNYHVRLTSSVAFLRSNALPKITAIHQHVDVFHETHT